MTYDSNISKTQGAVKASEIAVDRPLDVIKSQPGDSGMAVMDQVMRGLGDSLRRINYILFSDNEILWDGSSINFSNAVTPASITFRLLQTEDTVNQNLTASPALTPAATIDLVLQGSNTSNTTTAFHTVALNPGDILYLELDRNYVLDSVSNPSPITIQNNAGGSSAVAGHTAKITSSGMPRLTLDPSGNTQSFYIPLATVNQWSDGVTTFTDLLWIPHGIRWPSGTKSTLGSVIVSGLDHYYSRAVAIQTQLQQAITDLTTTGGIILVTDPITVDQIINIPEGITLTSRSNLTDSSGSIITVTTGGGFTMSGKCKISNISFSGSSTFGTFSSREDIIQTISSTVGSLIENCTFRLINGAPSGAGTANCITFRGDNGIAINCMFRLGTTVSYRIGVNYGGINNHDVDSIFKST